MITLTVNCVSNCIYNRIGGELLSREGFLERVLLVPGKKLAKLNVILKTFQYVGRYIPMPMYLDWCYKHEMSHPAHKWRQKNQFHKSLGMKLYNWVWNYISGYETIYLGVKLCTWVWNYMYVYLGMKLYVCIPGYETMYVPGYETLYLGMKLCTWVCNYVHTWAGNFLLE
jgi:hypothetical protein